MCDGHHIKAHIWDSGSGKRSADSVQNPAFTITGGTGVAENLQPMSSELTGALEMLSQKPDVPAIGAESHVKGIAEERLRSDDSLGGHIGEHAQEQVARYA